MELLPKELKNQLPELYGQEGQKDPIVFIKFFFPVGNWTWFVTEGSETGEDFMFFGYVIGFEGEWGYFSLNELTNVRVRGLTIERDLYFEKNNFSVCLKNWKAERGIRQIG